MSSNTPRGIHVAIIMDGNGRWATARGQLRTAGHIAGARTVRKIVEAAPDCGIGTLTLYAFSADNWKRPSREVALLMRLFRRYLVSEVARCVTNGVRMKIIGRRDRIPAELLRAICNAESATRDGRVLDLRIAVDYSARDAIIRAGRAMPANIPHDSDAEREEFCRLLSKVEHGIGESRDVDLLIRTGGEQRLSDFLLWECAYAELLFTRRMWPEFSPKDLAEAVEEFQSRERRFGTVPAAAAG
ncbi:MAG TPA: di-trans,poly-cis-decaprenylcistransferase [Gemmatimonadaceae bacterium]|nr:di-trans,poly-cis-decaprenylcistransferase [Gemmatimonadaceae bacterium]